MQTDVAVNIYRECFLCFECFVEFILRLKCRIKILNFCQNSSTVSTVLLSVQFYCQYSSTVALTQMAWIECFCLLFCRQQMKRLLYKLHFSLPSAIMFLFDWTVYKLLCSILLIRNFIKYFGALFLPQFLVLSLYVIFSYFLFSMVDILIFHSSRISILM